MSAQSLHIVSPEEARLIAMRAEALRRFTARYRHNPASQRSMLGGLRRLATTFSGGTLDESSFPWELLIDELYTQEMWDSVSRKFTRATAVRDASALRVMIDCCQRVGLITREQRQHARSFEARGGTPGAPAGHYLSVDDMTRIIESCERGSGGAATRARDTALVMTFAGSGARRNELANVQLKDTFLAENRIWLGRTKGGLPRDAFLHPIAVEALRRWLEVRGSQPGGLFVPLSRTGRPLIDHGPLSDFQMWKIVQKRAAEAGFEKITPHDMRRFLITHLLESVDLVMVAKVVGHKKTATTAAYDRRPAIAQRDAVSRLELPELNGLDLRDPTRAGRAQGAAIGSGAADRIAQTGKGDAQYG